MAFSDTGLWISAFAGRFLQKFDGLREWATGDTPNVKHVPRFPTFAGPFMGKITQEFRILAARSATFRAFGLFAVNASPIKNGTRARGFLFFIVDILETSMSRLS